MEEENTRSVLKKLLVIVLDIAVRLRVLWGLFSLASCLGEAVPTTFSRIVYKRTRGKLLPTNVGEETNVERVNFTTI